jgi:nitroreductase
MVTPLDDSALDTIFRKARTQNKWLDKPVSREQLAALYDLMRWGPTSANCFPVRIVFVTTPAAKERLKPLVLEGNRQKVTDAPVTAIIGYDTRFYDWLPRLFPHVDARSWFIDKPGFAETTAFRNSSLQAPTLSWRRGPSGSTADRCLGSTMRLSIGNSSPVAKSNRTLSVPSAMATRRACLSVCRVRISTRCARSCN